MKKHALKIAALSLLAVFMFSFVACNKKGGDDTTTTGGKKAASGTTVAQTDDVTGATNE